MTCKHVYYFVLVLYSLALTSLSGTPAAAAPSVHYDVVVTRTGFLTDICSFPVRVDRPAGQLIHVTDFYDNVGNLSREIERFTNFVNILVNPANGKSVTTYATGNHTYYALVVNPDDSLSLKVRTTGVLERVQGTGAVRAGITVEDVIFFTNGDLSDIVQKEAGLLREQQVCQMLA